MAIIIIGKKGFMFTLVAIFLIAIFVFVLYASSSHVFVAKQTLEAERTEGIIMNMYYESFRDQYLNTFMRIAGRNALQAMVAYVKTGNADAEKGIADPEEFVRRVFANGTVEKSYDISSASFNVDMTIFARNNSEQITVENMRGSGATVQFGADVAYAQYVIGDANNPLESITGLKLTIINNSATNDDIYAIIYDLDYNFLALDHLEFVDSDGDLSETIKFSFGADLPFDADHGYYIVLAAPFVAAGDFEVGYTSGNAAEKWLIQDDDSGTSAQIPIDFYLGAAMIKEGSLLGLTQDYALFGLENMNIFTTINISEVTINEKDPWTITSNATVLFNAYKTTVAYTNVPTTGGADNTILALSDPFNILMDWDLDIIIVNQTVSDDFSIDEFYTHISKQTFVFSENAPSFLQRFAGADAADKSSTCCGIQTILNTYDISSYSADQRGYSFVDHQFQTGSECSADDSRYVYHISSDPGIPEAWDSSLYGSTGPWYEWNDIEFYNLDEMVVDGYFTLVADCPESS